MVKERPVWNPPARVKYFSAGARASAYVPSATQMIAPLVAAAIAAASVLYGWAAVPSAAPPFDPSTNTVQPGIDVVRATCTACGTAPEEEPGVPPSVLPPAGGLAAPLPTHAARPDAI